MIVKWLPWKWLVKRAARSRGLIDPFAVLARLRRFAEPSEVEAPLELIRAWTVFQARGVVNTRAIQHNLDWIWPYWVERQFNPRDPSFVPRSFSLAHINLTHRNWTAVCLPDADRYALVDPRGLVTPLHDGWSLDAWIVADGSGLVPSRCREARQTMRYRGDLAIETTLGEAGRELASVVAMRRDGQDTPTLEVAWTARFDAPATLCVALRPYNPEGVQFIDSIERLENAPGWLVNRETPVRLDGDPERYATSAYGAGDVFHRLQRPPSDEGKVECPVGMATAAALFPLEAGAARRVAVRVPLPEPTGVFFSNGNRKNGYRPRTSWEDLDPLAPALEIPDERMTDLFGTATRTLLSLSAGEVYPGSYTYRRFWFRDACVMLNALLTLNYEECFPRALEHSFLRRQTLAGFFESQQGEWDSNGQVLWLAGRYASMFGKAPSPRHLKALRKGADWLCRKRRPRRSGTLHPGLLPSGFSAEHLGPNNFYYWDNFWGLAGLRAAADLFREAGDVPYADRLQSTADEYWRNILASLDAIPAARSGGAIPAAPDRRMDAGAVGSLVADYPLRLFDAADARIMRTAEFLLEHCMIEHGFFHDMTHSGINPYLTLHLAQVLLRAGDARFRPLVQRVAELASPAGQWPEAIHPHTGGGCMGDGQHGWAAAEWVLTVRSLFVREEADRLVLCPGLFPEWLDSGQTLRFGPTPTRFGSVAVCVETGGSPLRVKVKGAWRSERPTIDLAMPGDRDATVNFEEPS
jgi:hypothetical protein